MQPNEQPKEIESNNKLLEEAEHLIEMARIVAPALSDSLPISLLLVGDSWSVLLHRRDCIGRLEMVQPRSNGKVEGYLFAPARSIRRPRGTRKKTRKA